MMRWWGSAWRKNLEAALIEQQQSANAALNTVSKATK
jgi:hypothetical protein